MYEMKPEYFTGVDFIDREHARLFELAQETYDLLQDTFQYKTDQITALVSELIDYTRTHFSHEEAYQKEINYPFIYLSCIPDIYNVCDCVHRLGRVL